MTVAVKLYLLFQNGLVLQYNSFVPTLIQQHAHWVEWIDEKIDANRFMKIIVLFDTTDIFLRSLLLKMVIVF